MAEECEAGPAIHLPFDHFGPGVHALGPAVVKGQRDGRGHGLRVQLQPAGEGMDGRQVTGPGVLSPVLEPRLVPGLWPEQCGKEPTSLARLVISGQAVVSSPSSACWLLLSAAGRVSRSRATRLGDRCGRPASARPWVM